MKGLKIDKTDYAHLATKKVAIVVAEWNEQITFALRDAAQATLSNAGMPDERVLTYQVPGAFELPVAAKWLAERADVDGVICLGCVIQGDTRHFEFICQAVAQSLANLGLVSGKPVAFGVLTTDTFTQAEERAGGGGGNKGEEAAWTMLKMLDLREQLRTIPRDGAIGFSR